MNRGCSSPSLPLVVAIALATTTSAAEEDTLGEFEKAAGVENSRIGVESPEDEDDEFKLLGGALALPGLALFTASRTNEVFRERRAGEPAPSMLRLEGTYQRLADGDVDAHTTRGQFIWSSLGIGGEFTRYKEGSPKQSLDLTSGELLFRFLPCHRMNLILAIGARKLDGDRDETGLQGGLSFGLHPVEWMGLELDLRWAAIGDGTLEDYRAGALFRHPDFPFVALRGGYRIERIGGSSLDGAEVGVVLTF